MAAGDYSLEPHTCLQLNVDGGTVHRQGEVAFNDVVVTAERPLTPITVDLGVNGTERVGFYRCDAVVACTPDRVHRLQLRQRRAYHLADPSLHRVDSGRADVRPQPHAHPRR